ncbi:MULTISPECIES: restriction endonuclease [Noviherbaspirillum]|jgi:restriction system protein|uniref:DNA topoisomerase n=1 Tax=Noviherbaspirillum galbum TaxID=2709383 RepID=A0A6B3SY98_9BURK|nr:restriction endonuclease [Noviherbaspirillum galbum]NEX63622.1 DNA topoisomerase [Noviherbaspirillum galbum]
MARRRKKEGWATILVMLPWWVSAAAGCLAFAGMRWIIPSVFARHPFLVALGALSHALAWLALLLFGLLAAIAFVRSQTSGGSKPTARRTGMVLGARREPVVSSPPAKIDPGWGHSNQNAGPLPVFGKAFDSWTLEALRALEWKRFELLCAKYYEAVGFQSETLRCGADGGIDIKLFKIDPTKPIAIVQCKAWNAYSVGVKEVRELLGVMAHEKVGRGIFITTSTYTNDALTFGGANPMQLLDGPGFLNKILGLPQGQQDALRKAAFDGDYRTPTCASCGIKMTRRESQRGAFWGCVHYPRCKSRFPFSV